MIRHHFAPLSQARDDPCRGVSEEELAAVVARVDAAEREGALERWAQEDAPTAVIPEGQEPLPGTIEARQHWPELDATMLQLGNGMKVGVPPSVHADPCWKYSSTLCAELEPAAAATPHL